MSERTVPERHAQLASTGTEAGVPLASTPVETTPVEAIASPFEASTAASNGVVIHWEHARIKAIMPRVVSRAMSYSAMSCFDEALVASVQRFYGLDVDVATAETEVLEDDVERVRFFPWFLWDFRHGVARDGTTVGERFLAEGELTAIERRIVTSLSETAVDFWEVVALHPSGIEGHGQPGSAGPSGIEVVALGLGTRVWLEDDVLGNELSVGQIIQSRVVVIPLEAEGEVIALIDAIYAVLPATARLEIVAELASVIGPVPGTSPDAATQSARVAAMKHHAPELIDFAEYLLDAEGEVQAVANADGETMVLCSTIVLPGYALALEAALISGELGFVPTDAGDAWVSSDDDKPVGFVAHDVVHGRWIVGSPSRERLARITGRLREAGLETATLHAEETLERAAETWIETGIAGPHLAADPEVRDAFEGWLGGHWIDAPHPGLGDLSPRLAARDEALRPLLDRLVMRLETLLGRPISRDLGL